VGTFGEVSRARGPQFAFRRFLRRFLLEQKGPQEAPSGHQWAKKTGRTLSVLPTYFLGLWEEPAVTRQQIAASSRRIMSRSLRGSPTSPSMASVTEGPWATRGTASPSREGGCRAGETLAEAGLCGDWSGIEERTVV